MDRWGIEERYLDAGRVWRRVPKESVTRLRDLIGEQPSSGRGATVLVRGSRARLGRGQIELEEGGSVALVDRLPDEVPAGYHRFIDVEGEAAPLIVAPGRCHRPSGRNWGWAVQLYATRSQQSWGLGDLADLGRLSRWSTSRGAGFLLVNPLGAVTAGGPQPASPYSPASRRLRNPLYLHVEDVPGASGAPDVVARAAAAGQGLNTSRRIDRDHIWRLKQEALEAIWTAGAPREEFSKWRVVQPGYVELFARWSVLAERYGPRWRGWPRDCRSNKGPEVARVAVEDPDRVAFFAWLQWLVECQLGASSSVAVIEDLPIGVDPDGFDAWQWQGILAERVSVGAPPDEFNQAGQDWGIPPFVPWRLREADYEPFIETVRAALGSGGGLRIDHAAGLFRLWWIPDGLDPLHGAYVRYPADDLLGIIALESERAQAVVVGEDLGTVEEAARATLARRGVLSYRVLWFEETAPATWPDASLGAVTTHDLPTVSGLWTGQDVEDQRNAGVEPNLEGTKAIHRRLEGEAGLHPDSSPEDAIVGAYGLLAGAPSVLLCATLEDAAAEPHRPNIPGGRPSEGNWCRALGTTLEELEQSPLADRIGALLDSAVRGNLPIGPGSAPSSGSAGVSARPKRRAAPGP